ncbi:nitroreductase family protein [Streptomyces sp. SL13]|uniref:Nitroreductase family protein n=1 Tax=Streptantibioticus silvisoli TaxID=2705255 RepID=A0AA90JZT7_9ACTN|nr:nitroreductase family protein [Streptantibioticus silvisoli]MDI5972371.1 nitroreductase family protein [Streptantibioticus silvisoli]
MGVAHDYATAVMKRGRVAMEPADFVPDWADRPRKEKFFPGLPAFRLPDGDYPAVASLQAGLHGPGGDGEFSLPLLGGMLRDSYGLLGRRLGVQANTDLGSLPLYTHANFWRGTASGGGLYSVGVYWAAGPSAPVLPGLYHYAPPRHAMTRLLAGDVSGEVREALGAGAGEPGADGDQFLVLGVKFWQNSFKYNSFAYHVVATDVGSLVQTWRMWAAARGLSIGPVMWFDEERLAALLGTTTREEGVFAVVPLRWAGAAARPAPEPAPAVVHRDQERSRVLIDFPTVDAMQAATVAGGTRRPAPDALRAAAVRGPEPGGTRVALPEAYPLEMDVRRALRERRSSFGRFDARVPLDAARLHAVLRAADSAAAYRTDVTPDGHAPLVAWYVFVNHVDGIAPGSYAYDPFDGRLRLLKAGEPGAFLQANYFLSNYNLEQAGAVVVPAVRTPAVIDAAGDRGYRLVGALIGATAQAVYTASAAAGVGCGVALGFDAVSYIEELGLEQRGERPVLIMMVGNDAPGGADFRYDITGAGEGR